MIGRADIEGSKSNVAMNAWLPQAAYPRGNFSDTSSFKFRSQTPHPTMSSARIGRREAGLGSKKRGDAPPPFHGISKITRLFDARGKSPKERSQSVPRPARGDPLSPREQLEQSTDSRRVRDRDPRAQPLAANPFPEVTDPFCRLPLPTLFHRPEVCSPWRPDAVMSTTGREWHSVLRIFKGRRGRTGHHATCGALPAAGPYLRPSRFRGGQAVKQKR
ncbi:unnamed protein product [Prunus brigantina]